MNTDVCNKRYYVFTNTGKQMMPTMKGINASCDFFLLFAWIMSFKALLSDLLTYYGISVTKTYNYNILKPSEVHAY